MKNNTGRIRSKELPKIFNTKDNLDRLALASQKNLSTIPSNILDILKYIAKQTTDKTQAQTLFDKIISALGTYTGRLNQLNLIFNSLKHTTVKFNLNVITALIDSNVDLNKLSLALRSLKNVNLLTGELAQNNFEAIISAANSGELDNLIIVFDYLKDAGLFTHKNAKNNFNKILATTDISKLILHLKSGKLDQKIFDNAIARSGYRINDNSAGKILTRLNINLNNEKNRQEIIKAALSGKLTNLKETLKNLYKSGLLNGQEAQKFFDLLISEMEQNNLPRINIIFKSLKSTKLLIGTSAKENFMKIVTKKSTQTSLGITTCSILLTLDNSSVFTNEHAQSNFNSLFKINAGFEIAILVSSLKSFGLFNSETAQYNFENLITLAGINSSSNNLLSKFNDAIKILRFANLINSDNAQSIFNNLITAHNGQYLDDLNSALTILQSSSELSYGNISDNYNSLMKIVSGGDLKKFNAVLSYLQHYNLLSADDAQTNFLAIVSLDLPHKNGH